MPERQSRADQASQTRAALLDAARQLFVERGYFATGTEDIVSRAGVGTRGALYHHFADKEALFTAVLHEVQASLGSAIAARIKPGDALETLTSSLRGFLDCAAERADVQRILLVDGPAVLGWEAWRSMEAEYGLDAIESMLQQAVDEGIVDHQPLRPLAHMLLALVDEAALFIANAADPGVARGEVGTTIERLLGGLRTKRRKRR